MFFAAPGITELERGRTDDGNNCRAAEKVTGQDRVTDPGCVREQEEVVDHSDAGFRACLLYRRSHVRIALITTAAR